MHFDIAARSLTPFTELLSHVPAFIKARVTDIKISTHKPVMLCCGKELFFLQQDGTAVSTFNSRCRVAEAEEIEALFYHLCGHAVYSHADEIRHGYIAVDHGLRAGICGTAVVKNV